MIGISDNSSTNGYANGIGVVANDLYLSTAGTQRIRINSSGNVGIGTTSPSTKLHIDDDATTGTGLKVTGGGAGGPLATFTRDVGSSGTIAINSSNGDPQILFASAANTFALGANGSTFEIADNSSLGTNPRLSITSAGKVGIGTTNPTAMVTAVSPNGNSQSLRIGRLDSANYWDFNHAGDDLRIYSTSGSGSNILLGVNSGGAAQGNRVGVGTASPATALDVVGTIKNSSYTVNNLPSASPAGQRAFISDSSYSLSSSISYDSIGGGGSIFIPVYSDGTAWKAG
jgi:hypothetical protein